MEFRRMLFRSPMRSDSGMEKISKAALAAALVMTAGGLVVTAPALAKDKKQEQQGPQLKLGDAVRKAAVAAQTALQAKDYATAQTNVDAVLAAATNDDERDRKSVV